MEVARQVAVWVLVFSVALFASTAVADSIEWPVASGGNGHFYEAVASGSIIWEDARIAAEGAGGYLATITSTEENAFVFGLVDGESQYWNGPSGPWLGGFQPPDSPEPAGNWQWVTGEPFDYTNWHPGEPTNTQSTWPGEDGLIFWVDGPMWCDVYRLDPETFVSYIIEYPPYPVSLDVGIDVKPGNSSNPMNPKSKGVIPLAVLGSEGFDVSEIDLDTLVLEGASPRPRGKSGKVGSFVDINGDSFVDLILHFDMEDVEIDFGTEQLTLMGELDDGTVFEGSDSISTVPPFADAGSAGSGFDSSELTITRTGAAVPEPATVALIVVGGLLALRPRKTT